MNISTAYESDILDWSEHQAALLRRRAAGELINESDLDWCNIAEEIESLGRSELRACESLILQWLSHLLKAEAWPDSVPAARWRLDAEMFRWQASRAFSPAMAQRIDLPRLYARAVKWLPSEIDGQKPLPLPPLCPVTFDDLQSEE